ncbi:hypothetical protein EVAR_65843_1 [Eumeta japonica]|uniref:Uncharacterized protein n=1 Tax=Eumeta variegata TaxID=151549 RepID=A0A4C2A5E6_EUMVA|nr:hypothetical protein EVAR_65843_1 [Eumeta japonica]
MDRAGRILQDRRRFEMLVVGCSPEAGFESEMPQIRGNINVIYYLFYKCAISYTFVLINFDSQRAEQRITNGGDGINVEIECRSRLAYYSQEILMYVLQEAMPAALFLYTQ